MRNQFEDSRENEIQNVIEILFPSSEGASFRSREGRSGELGSGGGPSQRKGVWMRLPRVNLSEKLSSAITERC